MSTAEPQGAPAAAPVLEVADLKKHFPIIKGCSRPRGRAGLRRRRRVLDHSKGRDPRPRRRERLRQDRRSAGPSCRLIEPTSRHASASTAATSPSSTPPPCARFRRDDADHLPGPLFVAQPAHDRAGDIVGEPLRIHNVGQGRRAREACRLAARSCRPCARRHDRVPARVLGRPAPAHRHRPRPRAQPAPHRLRRAGLRPRRLDPGPGPQPADRPAAASSASPISSSPTTSPWSSTSATASR